MSNGHEHKQLRGARTKGSDTMGHRARGWLVGIGGVVAGVTVLGLAPLAGASAQGVRQTSASGSTARPGSAYASTTQPLTFGMRGPAVKALQERLNFLHYYAGKPDGIFGWNTMEAVWAFKEVQSGKAEPKNPDIVGPIMQRELKHPKAPRVLVKRGHWTRVEINKNVGVLVVYHGKRSVLISHISSAATCRPDGCGWVTPDGKYHTWLYLAGPVADATFGGYMYNPVFFIGTSFAIHGMPNPTSTFSPDGVPLNAASHGCVRIPMDISVFFHKLVHVSSTNGTPVYIFGGQQDYSGI
jgi:hypothetical protein